MSKVAETIAEVGLVLAEALVKLYPNADERSKVISQAEMRRANELGRLADLAKFGPPDHEED